MNVRSFGICSLLLLAVQAAAQNWALLNPSYKYNYAAPGSSVITDQVWVTHIDTLGVDSFRYDMNKRARLCPSCEPTCDLQVKVPRCLMGSIIVHAGRWAFSDTANYILYPNAGLGATWMFAPDLNATGTLVNVEELLLYGFPDSAKTMVSDAGDTVVWSKNFGIIRWRKSTSSDDHQVGVHGPDVGVLIPSLSDFYPYQAGDRVDYSWGGTMDNYSYSGQSRYDILSRADYPDSIIFQVLMTWHHEVDFQHSWGTGPAKWKVDGSRYGAIAFSSPDEFVPDMYMPPGIWQNFTASAVAEHLINDEGYYEIRAKQLDMYHLFRYNGSPDQECIQTLPVGPIGTSNSLIYDTQVGLRGYGYISYYFGYGFWFRGAIIAGDTVGTLVTSLNTSVPEEGDPSMAILWPNPAHDQLNIQGASGSVWSILDVDGRSIQSGRINDAGPQIVDVSLLAEGIYLLQADKAGSRRTQRFIILH